MTFEIIIGQKKIQQVLTLSLQRKRLPHALLFHGSEGVGKEAMALELAKAIICQQDEVLYCNQCSDCKRISQLTHPDLFFIFPMPKKAQEKEQQDIIKSIVKNPYLRLKPWVNPAISIERIRELKQISALTSFENKGRVVIIADAHQMTIEASNSLLKILEEPPPKMTIILTSAQLNLLLPTIISRCQSLQFAPLSWLEIETTLIKQSVAPERAQLVSKLSYGSYRRALELLEEELDQKRKQVIDILRTVILDDYKRIELVETLIKEDKRSIRELLELMLLWVRDALILIEGQDKQQMIVNIDQVETLEKFCHTFESLNFVEIVAEIEKAIDLIDKNVYVNLVLINLFHRLKKQLRRKHV